MKKLIKISTVVMLTFVIGALSGCFTVLGVEYHYSAESSDSNDSQLHCTECASNVRKVRSHKASRTEEKNIVEEYYEVKVEVSYHPFIQWYESDVQGKLTKNGRRAMKQDAENAEGGKDGSGGGGGC